MKGRLTLAADCGDCVVACERGRFWFSAQKTPTSPRTRLHGRVADSLQRDGRFSSDLQISAPVITKADVWAPLLFQRLANTICDHRRIVVDGARDGALKAVGSRDEQTEPALELVDSNPSFV